MVFLGKYKVVSLDMFQTLVNPGSRIVSFWKRVLDENLEDETACKHEKEFLGVFLDLWSASKERSAFSLMREVYMDSFKSLPRHNWLFDLNQTVDILFDELSKSNLYEDTVRFLKRVASDYQLCIVSDADDAMLPDFYKDYEVDMYTSERYQSYKNDNKNVMFTLLAKRYRIDPVHIFHIGDSVSDVCGAHRCGITTCWLNRNNLKWEYSIKPDYIVKSLDEAASVLNRKV